MKFEHSHDKLHDAQDGDDPAMCAIITLTRKEGADSVYGLSLEVTGMSDVEVVAGLGHVIRYLIRERHLTFRDIMGAIFHVVDTGRTEIEQLEKLRRKEAGEEE